jgi:ribulose bisphosphate carboxylase small subunit
MAFYIAPQFLSKLSVHITKNYLNLPNVRVPLILGIHGRKGEGKSFQCDLVFQKMGIEAVYMSAGELESPDAGDPARLIRLRYREAGELVKVRGKMAVLLINDIDAGIGRVDQYTQYTVNTQLVHGTLMNIADNPTNVQLPGSYDSEPTKRIPIIVTGNDFSTLYAPLVRDGRMEKYFWDPTRADRLGIVSGIFAGDQVATREVETLVDTFGDQSIDFYGALRSRLYDEQVHQFITDVGLEKISARVVNSKDPLPEFRRPDFSLSHLIEVGQQMVREQQRIQELRLVETYNQNAGARKSLPTPDTIAPHGNSNGKQNSQQNNQQNGHHHSHHPGSYAGSPSSSQLTVEMITEVNRILNQGDRIGIEYTDARRFRSNGSWQCYGTFAGNVTEAIQALETCLSDHAKDYIRLVGIHQRDRLTEMMVHRPNG